MNMRTSGNFGCLLVVLVLILFVSIFSMFTRFLFTTPLGLVLLVYLIYRHYKKQKMRTQMHAEMHPEEEVNYGNDEDAIEVDYEEYD